MPLTVWISIFGSIVVAAVALHVGYMHRRQMRQIALHQVDPSIPLVPPPHPITRFVKTWFWYLYSLAFAIFDIFVLIKDLTRPSPVTRTVVFYICLDMIALVWMMIFLVALAAYDWFKIWVRSEERVADILKEIVRSIDRLEERGNNPPKAKQQ